MRYWEIFFTWAIFLPIVVQCGSLYPKVTPTRQSIYLDGIWRFSLSNTTSAEDESLSGNANDRDLHWMAVPSSYNDILTTLEGRDYVGLSRYDKTFFVPPEWSQSNNNRIWLRFGSVCVSARAYINGQFVVEHETGHLPFKSDITSLLQENENTITVIVNNTLTNFTIPQGYNQESAGGQIKQLYKFDFFNYAGIDRPVVLYRTPNIYVEDMDITTSIEERNGTVRFSILLGGVDDTNPAVDYKVSILDANSNRVASKTNSSENGIITGVLHIENANLWWPFLMSDTPGYQYTLRVDLNQGDTLIDRYDQKFGIRVVTYDNDSVQLNGKRIYLRGVNKHEDSDIRGKGFDLPLILRDHNLLRWLGVNAYRTSHYPYAEEIMDIADYLGIMIIDEVPSVDTDLYSDQLLANHKQAFTELYQRDKNRPSVIMWSIANEPNTERNNSINYFRKVVEHVKSYDKSRPVTLTNYRTVDIAKDVFQYLDVVSVNRYQGWYVNPGDSKAVSPEVFKEINLWRETYNKPILVTEYGADTIEGIHYQPSYIGSEEYQLDILSGNWNAFDQLRPNSWFLGELIWNFADFKTGYDVRRIGGNKKGVFDRQRQPKTSAFVLRKRYWNIANEYDNVELPTDLDRYFYNDGLYVRDEL